MKLLVDMNLSPRWCAFLFAGGVDSKHWSELGPANSADADIMAYAQTSGYVVLTHDLDFGAILAATGGNSPSVVQIRARDISPEAIGTKVLVALEQCAVELSRGALLTVEADRNRLRVLPLKRKSSQQ
jgi:predicted nuclease of predicted toxin-antitoxin system